MLCFTPAIRRNRREAFARHADAWSGMIESFTGISTVKATAVESAVRWKMETQFVESRPRTLIISFNGAADF